MAEHLPHEEYVVAVFDALGELGAAPENCWTETPDGEQLDGVVTFDTDTVADEWPDGVFLGWDQRSGWSMVSTGENRNTFDLDLDLYASPRAVAARTADRLKGVPDSPTYADMGGHVPYGTAWDGAEALAAAVTEWEADR